MFAIVLLRYRHRDGTGDDGSAPARGRAPCRDAVQDLTPAGARETVHSAGPAGPLGGRVQLHLHHTAVSLARAIKMPREQCPARSARVLLAPGRKHEIRGQYSKPANPPVTI